MKAHYDSGYTHVITDDTNPHDVAAIFKEFLRCLPDPLLTRDLYPAFLFAASKMILFIYLVFFLSMLNSTERLKHALPGV